MTAARGDLRVERWTPVDIVIPFVGLDSTGAAGSLQVRLFPDATGDPVLNLTFATPPAEGLSMSVASVDGLTTSTLRILINEPTIETLLPFPANGLEAGGEVRLAYALHLTSTAFPKKRRWLEGAFIILPGANHA